MMNFNLFKFLCVVIEECKQNVIGIELGVCDINVVCINIDGLFECECKDGFIGSGFVCIGISKYFI